MIFLLSHTGCSCCVLSASLRRLWRGRACVHAGTPLFPFLHIYVCCYLWFASCVTTRAKLALNDRSGDGSTHRRLGFSPSVLLSKRWQGVNTEGQANCTVPLVPRKALELLWPILYDRWACDARTGSDAPPPRVDVPNLMCEIRLWYLTILNAT